MSAKIYKVRVIVTACSFALVSMSGIADAEGTANPDQNKVNQSANSKVRSDDVKDAMLVGRSGDQYQRHQL